ncbi:MAG: nucleoid-associated protein EbfC [Actinomycetota bacterium]|jgi:DNA-binding YbaB/EbfC family protein|nr:nucleoid-associated protein EbfC [Actinomycetota bacterium]
MKDMQRMMREAQKMAAEMQKVQDELAELEVEGSAGGGAVKVKATGDQRVLSVTLDPDLLSDVDADDVEMIGDTITAAVNDALNKGRDAQAEAMGPLAGGLGGMGLPGLG